MKRKSNFVPSLVVALLFMGATLSMSAGDNDGCRALKTAVMQENGSGISGQASLCFGEAGVHVRMSVQNLIPGRAYTVWFVYFNNPSNCITAPGTTNPCGPPDLIKPLPDGMHPDAAPAGVFGRMDSAVADMDGTARFSARLQDFHVSAGSHVHLAIFVHDSASNDNYARARQLLTPENPVLGSPGLGLGTQRGFLAAAAIFHIPSNTGDDE